MTEAVLRTLMEHDVEGMIHCPAGHCAAMAREGARAAMSAVKAVRPTGMAIATVS